MPFEGESHRISRDRLYFDGFLPGAKEPVRVARLESYLKRLITYKSTHPGPFRVHELASAPRAVEVSKLFHDVRPVPTQLSSLPAPPFLVPAVIEALTHSQYGSITEVVPAEADVFCAARARSCGGVVLSSDSDFLVADLGANGSVSLFKDLSLDSEDGSKTVKTSIFKPRNIAAYLGLSDLLGLAFELTKDSTISSHEAIRRAKLLTKAEDENVPYQNFISYYGSATDPGSDSIPYSKNETESQPIDPRVSELLLLYHGLALKTEGGAKVTDSTFQPKVYLPFLLDDPARSSAWVISTSLRIIAYSLLNSTSGNAIKPTTIAEYGRSGHRIVPKYPRLLTRVECITHCTALAGRLQKARSYFKTQSSSGFWPLYGLYELCRWCRENDKPLPCQDVMEKVIKVGRKDKSISNWDDIHLSMQLQGVLYSLRILRQVITQLRMMDGVPTTDYSRELLHGQLGELPPLEELFPFRYHVSSKQPQDRCWDDINNAISDLLGAEFVDSEHVTSDSQQTSMEERSEFEYAGSEAFTRHQGSPPQKKRRKRAADGSSAQRNTPKHTDNMYTMLNRS